MNVGIAMKLKILTVTLMLTLLVNTSISVIGDNNVKTTSNVDDSKVKEIRIAMLSEFPLGWGELLPLHVAAVDGYQWKVGNTSYKFNLTKIYDNDILSGGLSTKNYDVLLVPGAGVGDSEAITKGFYRLPRVKKWKNAIADFVKDGGGYVGICGGAMLMAEVYGKPRTFMERQYQTSSPGVSCVKQVFPGVYSIAHKQDGPLAYANFYPQDYDIYTVEGCSNCRSGVPLDVTIFKNHPVFDDFLENMSHVMWVGGPGLVLPDNLDRDVNVLAQYPLEEISDNISSTRICKWKYTGGIRGYIRGFLKGIKLCKEYNESLSNAFQYAYFCASDWKPTNEVIKVNLSGQPCMTEEVYPNENKSRIFLCALHPEYTVWWGGHIENMPDTNDNCIHEAFYRWVDITPFDQTPEDEVTHNWWMERRQIAWAAKVPDNDLPPVYGASQVSDIYPYNLSSNFTVTGNTKEESEGIMSLDLCYRSSNDNISWDDWTLYGTDIDSSDGWSWEFNASMANGPGYYQFYSIRNVQYEDHTETAPLGPDAIAYVKIN